MALFLKFFEVALHSEMPNNFICILITDFASYVFSGQNIYIHILLINYFLLLINIHIVIHKGPEIEPKNNTQVTGVPIFAVLAMV